MLLTRESNETELNTTNIDTKSGRKAWLHFQTKLYHVRTIYHDVRKDNTEEEQIKEKIWETH